MMVIVMITLSSYDMQNVQLTTGYGEGFTDAAFYRLSSKVWNKYFFFF